MICLLWLTCCKDDGDFTGDGGGTDGTPWKNDLVIIDSYINPCAPGAPPTVTGKVLAPNGIDPVAGASVGVPVTLTPMSQIVQCESCVVQGNFAAHTYSKADGSFTLKGVPNGIGFKLSIRKGHFRRLVQVAPLQCATVALPAASTNLPGRNGHYSQWDSIPNIAVISGSWDKLEKVLDKLGVTQKDFFNGKDWPGTGSQSMQALLQNLGRMKGYHLILINCGTKFEALVTSPGPVRENVRAYIKAGGRIFATDFSYDYVEQVFPEFIDFQGSDSTSKGQPEQHNAAEVGAKDLVIDGTIQDTQLKAWLNLPPIKALQANGTVKIEGFMEGWAVQKTVSTAVSTKVWVTGPAKWWGGSGVRPLTASHYYQGTDKKGCGRVIFSSYHTYGNKQELLPQERILEYLLLEIGECRKVE